VVLEEKSEDVSTNQHRKALKEDV